MRETENNIETNYVKEDSLEVADSFESESEEERRRRLRRKRRIEQMRREKQRAMLRRRLMVFGAAAVVVIALVTVPAVKGITAGKEPDGTTIDYTEESSQVDPQTLVENPVSQQVDGNVTASYQTGEDASVTQQEDDEDASATQLAGGEGSEGEQIAGSVSQVAAQPEAYDPSVVDKPEVYGPMPTEKPQPEVFSAARDSATAGFGEAIISQYGILIDVENGTILAQKDAKVRMSPASMTKILTVLTAADALGITSENWETAEVLDDTFTITIEITDYSFVNDCSNVGFEVGEVVPVRDLFYGTILPSGGDAALGLAYYVAGSQEAFVELMNEKLEELGLSETTHFTNCVGLYDENHYSTAYDMAVLLKTAADNVFCRNVLSAHTYNTAATEQHPEGLLCSNWFLRRIEDKDTHGEVLCGKTGYVVQSGSCAASLATDGAGKEYLCVTAGSSSSWQCIYDQVALYEKYLQP